MVDYSTEPAAAIQVSQGRAVGGTTAGLEFDRDRVSEHATDTVATCDSSANLVPKIGEHG